MRVLREIRRSPLALDSYVWPTWRFQSAKASLRSLGRIDGAMRGDYERADNFVQKAKSAFANAGLLYPAMKLNYAKGAFTPCLPRLPDREARFGFLIKIEEAVFKLLRVVDGTNSRGARQERRKPNCV
jgi:hypothetical protein